MARMGMLVSYVISQYILGVAAFDGNGKVGQLTDFFQFRTRPDILAPRWNITVYDDEALAAGYWFVAPYLDIGSLARGEAFIAPHIYDQHGELVWSGAPAFDHYKAHDLRIARVGGISMLTAIYPHNNSAVIMDKHYQVVKNVVHSSSPKHSNMHDFNVVLDGTRALVLTHDDHATISKEKTKVVGLDRECVARADGMKYLDITKDPVETLFSWNGSDHIGLDETFFKGNRERLDALCDGEKSWDIHHMNSVDLFPDGDFLLSARNTEALYKISHVTGEIIWRLGGNRSDFLLPQEAQFNFQHHARVRSQNDSHLVISLMDNSKGGPGDDHPHRAHSAGLILALDTNAMTGELLAEYPWPHEAYNWKRGSAQILENGNGFMCWAVDMQISEHASDGRVLMEAHVLPHLGTYRAYKYEWTGQPLEPPNVYSAAFLAGRNVTTMVYVSWNGATEVAEWKFYKSNGVSAKKDLIASVRRKGFETELNHDGSAPYVFVEAVNGNGDVIGSSKMVKTIPPVEQEQMSVDADIEGVAHDTLDASAKLPETGNNDSLVTITNAILFLLGFACCVAVVGAGRMFQGLRRRQWWRQTDDVRYDAIPLDSHEQDETVSRPKVRWVDE